MKKIIISLIIIIILIGISCIIVIPRFFTSYTSNNNDNVVKEETNKIEEKNVEVETEVNEEVVEESTVVDNSPTYQEKVDDKKAVQEKEETISTETVDISISNPVSKEEPKHEEVASKKEEVIVKTAWEELGISEYDYYHKPMWSWARVDFSIDTYKTYEKTREACITKGDKYFEQGLGYSCTSINSYSGDYLGEMIKTF